MYIKKHRKIFYVPGMISLVILPLMCIGFILFRGYQKKYTVIGYGLDEEYSKNIIKNNPKIILRENRIYNFESSLEVESTKLLLFQKELKKLHNSNSSKNGIQIHLGKKMDYDVFIRLLDLIEIEGTQTYYQLNNDLYILGNVKREESKKNINVFKCGYAEANKVFFKEREIKKSIDLFVKQLRERWVILVAYLGIVILNVFFVFKINWCQK